jgi:hypothetical protein
MSEVTVGAFLFVAIALPTLVLSAVRRHHGHLATPTQKILLVATTGVGLGFVSLLARREPMVLALLGLAAVLVLGWVVSGRAREAGIFLIAGAGLWVAVMGARLWLAGADAPSPAETVYPFAAGVAVVVIGAVLVLADVLAASLRPPKS